jgi:ATP-binding cassette subfamily C protein
MRVIFEFVRGYPWASAFVLFFLVIASLAEGASLGAAAPMLALAFTRGEAGAAEADHDDLSRGLLDALARIGIQPSLGVLIGVLVVGMTLKSGLDFIAYRHVGYTIARVATDLRLALVRALLAVRWEYFLGQPVGRFTNAMSSEADRASKTYFHGAKFMATAIQLCVYTGVALLVSWQATFYYLASAAAIAVLLHRLVRLARRAGKRQTRILRAISARLTDSILSVKSLKAMGREKLADRMLAGQANDLNRALRLEVIAKEGLKAAQQPIFALLLGAGLWFAVESWQLPASRAIVLLYLFMRVLATVGKLQELHQNVAVGESAYWALQAMIHGAEEHRELPGGTRQPQLAREIRFDDVHFAYADGAPVLRGVALEFPAGSFTALIGASGAGKTTLVDLIIGLVLPQRGAVRVDGVPLEEHDLHAWRRLIGYVPQDALLLHDSVLHNVTLGDASLDEAAVERALRAAGAWEFVSALPEGMHASVGERGTRLSGGQRQRIVLARAIAHEPKLLILDEATSALDPETEAEVWQILKQLRGRMTIVSISHRPALVRSADRVYQIEKGTAVRVGEGGLAVALPG